MSDGTGPEKKRQPRYAIFEKKCAIRPYELGLQVDIQRVERYGPKIYASLPDLEVSQFPEYVLDCKYTENEFSIQKRRKLLEQTENKYSTQDSICAIICGEKRGKISLSASDVTICFRVPGTKYIIMYPYDDWLHMLNDSLLERMSNP